VKGKQEKQLVVMSAHRLEKECADRHKVWTKGVLEMAIRPIAPAVERKLDARPYKRRVVQIVAVWPFAPSCGPVTDGTVGANKSKQHRTKKAEVSAQHPRLGAHTTAALKSRLLACRKDPRPPPLPQPLLVLFQALSPPHQRGVYHGTTVCALGDDMSRLGDAQCSGGVATTQPVDAFQQQSFGILRLWW